MGKIIPTVGIAVIKDEKVLLVRHGEKADHLSDTYGLPAGRIEDNETGLQAAIRELREETGLNATEENLEEYPNNKYTAEIQRKNSESKIYAMRVFICQSYSGNLKKTEECVPEWVDIDFIRSLNLLPNVYKATIEAKEYLDGQ